MPIGIDIWIPARGVAIRLGRRRVVRSSYLAMVECKSTYLRARLKSRSLLSSAKKPAPFVLRVRLLDVPFRHVSGASLVRPRYLTFYLDERSGTTFETRSEENTHDFSGF
jgi:hypothetical protein